MGLTPSPQPESTILELKLQQLGIEKLSATYEFSGRADAPPAGLVIFCQGPLCGKGIYRIPADSQWSALEAGMQNELGPDSFMRLVTKEYLTFIRQTRFMDGVIEGLGETIPEGWTRYKVKVNGSPEFIGFDSRGASGAMADLVVLYLDGTRQKLDWEVCSAVPGSAETPLSGAQFASDVSRPAAPDLALVRALIPGVPAAATPEVGAAPPPRYKRLPLAGVSVVALGIAAWFGTEVWNRHRVDANLNEALAFVGIQSPITDGMTTAKDAAAALKKGELEKSIELFEKASILYATLEANDRRMWDYENKLFDLAADEKGMNSSAFKELQGNLLQISEFKVTMSGLITKLYQYKDSALLSPGAKKSLAEGLARCHPGLR